MSLSSKTSSISASKVRSSSPTVSFMMALAPTPSPHGTSNLSKGSLASGGDQRDYLVTPGSAKPYTPSSVPCSSKHGSGFKRDYAMSPPGQIIRESLTTLASVTVSQLEEVWDEIGYNPEERDSQLSALVSSFRCLCEDKVAEERGVAETFRQTIADAKEEMRNTSQALRVDVDGILMEENNGQSLTDELATLEATLEGMRAASEAATADLAESRDKLVAAHTALGIYLEDEWQDITSDLTQERRLQFRKKVVEMEEEVITRKVEIIQLLQDCQRLLAEMSIDVYQNELDRKISLSLIQGEDESTMLSSVMKSEDCVGISCDALDSLNVRMAELIAEKKRRKNKLSEMGAEICMLWEKLHVPTEEQRLFTESVQFLGMDTIEKGKNELKRLHELKAQMIGKLIQEAREAISQLWDETSTDDGQRANFKAMTITDESLFTDDLLAEHEEHIKQLQEKLEQMKPILKIMEKREDIIKERMEYEDFQKDPDRLKQRGAALTKQLMKEEKMSRRIKRDLPKYTEILERKLREWQTTHTEEFMYKGEPYLDVMKQQEEEWRRYKDNETQRNLRRKQEEKSLENRNSNDTHYKPLPGKKRVISVNGSRPSSRGRAHVGGPLSTNQVILNGSRASSRGRSHVSVKPQDKRSGSSIRPRTAPSSTW
mmetsp:Transcript_38429/g.57590  ORF Transcript_38429/g.57590 Transcript_38429/m.57590 type:complete len:658 (-) Transcript_38429:662-2635(-)